MTAMLRIAMAQFDFPVGAVDANAARIETLIAEARDLQWPHYQEMFGRLGRERGWPATTKDRYIAEIEDGSLYVGSVETVAKKIAATVKVLGLQRFDMKYATGPMPHQALVDAIGLYGAQVMPMVRDILATDK